MINNNIIRHGDKMSDATYLKAIYYNVMGEKLNLRSPATFTEKIQWLKLYNRRPELIDMVDKVKAKEYAGTRIGNGHIIPTYGVWDRSEDIDFGTLPERFVIKTSHDSGGYVICRDKKSLDTEAVRKKLARLMERPFYSFMREWAYKGVTPRILAEELIEDTSAPGGDLVDYKFYCFNGEPRYCQVIQNRSTEETIDFYDMEWRHQPFIGLNPAARFADTPVPRPECLEEMAGIARRLADGMDFVRIDLYEVNGHVYFGEITLYPNGGLGRFIPESWNRTLGDMMTGIPTTQK